MPSLPLRAWPGRTTGQSHPVSPSPGPRVLGPLVWHNRSHCIYEVTGPSGSQVTQDVTAAGFSLCPNLQGHREPSTQACVHPAGQAGTCHRLLSSLSK